MSSQQKQLWLQVLVVVPQVIEFVPVKHRLVAQVYVFPSQVTEFDPTLQVEAPVQLTTWLGAEQLKSQQ